MTAISPLRRKLRRFWLALPSLAILTAIAVYIYADRLTREPPNYSKIEDGLWLGGVVAEPPRGTQAVLNLCELEDTYHAESHRWEPIRDAEPAPSLEWLREKVDFIVAERSAGRSVYVHCRNGVSRSSMVVIAYFMARDGLSRDRALELVRSRRPEVRPNPAFMTLLAEWEKANSR